nr:hypothetical protein Iba_chr06dCG7490 [Ipomoea batatas]
MKSRYARMGKEYMFNTNAQMRTQWKRTGAVVSEGRQVAEAGELIGYSAGRGRGGAKQAIRGGGAADVAETLRNSTVPSIVDEAVNMEVGVDENVSDQRGGRVSSMVAAFNLAIPNGVGVSFPMWFQQALTLWMKMRLQGRATAGAILLGSNGDFANSYEYSSSILRFGFNGRNPCM